MTRHPWLTVLAAALCACNDAGVTEAAGSSSGPGATTEASANSEATARPSTGSPSTGNPSTGNPSTGDPSTGGLPPTSSADGSSTGVETTAGIDCDELESHLPLVFIETGGQPIPDDPKIDALLRIVDNGEGNMNCWGDAAAYEGDIGIERRGSTSQQLHPKVSYGVETRDALGQDLDVPILGMPAESDWVLYAPYSDKTMIRNVLAYHLHNEMGRYSTRTRYVEVMLNGEYWGVHVWEEKIKRGSARVPITKLETTDVAGDAVTGGYILKIDKLTGNVGASWVSPHSNEVTFQVHYPKGADIVPAQAQYIEAAATAMEDVLAGPGFADPRTGYASLIDVPSFIDFMILQELSRPVDGYRSSAFLYKDRDSAGGRFVAGPMWDFNVAFGHADYCDAYLTTGYQYEFDAVCGQFFDVEVPFWWQRLLEDPAFGDALRCRWEALRTGPLSDASLVAFIEATAMELGEAQVRNFERWPILGVYVDWNPYVGETYQDEVDYLLTWIVDRAQWLDANFGGTC